MCGVTGYLTQEKKRELKEELSSATNVIKFRGPDNQGVYFNNEGLVGLGHRRLSIQDLSSSGNQPMVSASRRYWIVFNGEIYNHLELRKSIPFYSFKGTSDTETILALIDTFGIKESISKLNGMFAIAIWDEKENILTLSRDKFGEKPLYYYNNETTLLFSSDIRSFKEFSIFKGEINIGSVQEILRFNYINAPNTIYEDTFQVIPGELIEINLKLKSTRQIYYSPSNLLYTAKRQHWNYEEAKNDLNNLLRKSVVTSTISDVPIGTLLSGGIDSSLITSILANQSSKRIKTFTIGYESKLHDESKKAKDIANYLGTEHHEFILTSSDVKDIIPNIHDVYSEPFADPSMIPTSLLCREVSKHVKVVMTGDGADELFAGYNRYLFSQKYWPIINKLPINIRNLISASLIKIPEDRWDVLLRNFNIESPGYKVHKASRILSSRDNSDLYKSIISNQFYEKISMVSDKLSYRQILNNSNLHHIENMMMQDTLDYLPSDILTKVDRAGMFFSIENRTPYLSKEIVEFAWSLPLNYKIQRGKTKIILKDVLGDYIPKRLYDQPKMGFGFPLNEWLRTELKEWGSYLINNVSKDYQNLFNNKFLISLWEEHLIGHSNRGYQLWPSLILLNWLDNQ